MLACLAGLLLATPSLALGPGELRLGGGPAYLRLFLPSENNNGVGGMVHLSLGLSGSTGLDMAGCWALHEPIEEEEQSGSFSTRFVSAALRYLIDQSAWEPYLLAGLGLYQGGPDLESWSFGPLGLLVGLGLDLGLWASWLPGVEMRYHAFLDEPADYPHYFSLTLRIDGLLRIWQPSLSPSPTPTTPSAGAAGAPPPIGRWLLPSLPELETEGRAHKGELLAQPVLDVALVCLGQSVRVVAGDHEGRGRDPGLGDVVELDRTAAIQRGVVGLHDLLEAAVQGAGWNAQQVLLPHLVHQAEDPGDSLACERGYRDDRGPGQEEELLPELADHRVQDAVVPVLEHVPLVQQDHGGPTTATYIGRYPGVLVCDWAACIEQEAHHVGAVDGPEGPDHSVALQV